MQFYICLARKVKYKTLDKLICFYYILNVINLTNENSGFHDKEPIFVKHTPTSRMDNILT